MKMRFYLFYIIIFVPTVIAGQINSNKLSPQEKAYLYHTVMKSKVMSRTIGDCFHYNGLSKPLKPSSINKGTDYDYICREIINDTTLISIDEKKLLNAPEGVLAEASTMVSLWSLYSYLYLAVESSKNAKTLFTDSLFGSLIHQYLPKKYFFGNEKRIKPEFRLLFHPNNSFRRKISILEENGYYDVIEQKLILETISLINESYLMYTSRRIFSVLKGSCFFNSHLLAVGEGSKTTGLLNEYDIDSNTGEIAGRGIGLFTYDYYISSNNNLKKISLKNTALLKLDAFRNKHHNLHFNIWGLNAKKQTTVVIEINNNTYVLFASVLSKELSPSPKQGIGTTYIEQIVEIENQDIEKLYSRIYGENGYYKSLKYEMQKKTKTEIKLNELEDDADAVSSYQKKLVKTSEKITIIQQKINNVNNEIDKLRNKVFQMKHNLGGNMLSYVETDDMYVFEDSSTFNLFTQNFQFVTNDTIQEVKIRLLGNDPLKNRTDEVQLHINYTPIISKSRKQNFENKQNFTIFTSE